MTHFRSSLSPSFSSSSCLITGHGRGIIEPDQRHPHVLVGICSCVGRVHPSLSQPQPMSSGLNDRLLSRIRGCWYHWRKRTALQRVSSPPKGTVSSLSLYTASSSVPFAGLACSRSKLAVVIVSHLNSSLMRTSESLHMELLA